jgi:hypothetical protein
MTLAIQFSEDDVERLTGIRPEPSSRLCNRCTEYRMRRVTTPIEQAVLQSVAHKAEIPLPPLVSCQHVIVTKAIHWSVSRSVTDCMRGLKAFWSLTPRQHIAMPLSLVTNIVK